MLSTNEFITFDTEYWYLLHLECSISADQQVPCVIAFLAGASAYKEEAQVQ
jgi:hypothetical protein